LSVISAQLYLLLVRFATKAVFGAVGHPQDLSVVARSERPLMVESGASAVCLDFFAPVEAGSMLNFLDPAHGRNSYIEKGRKGIVVNRPASGLKNCFASCGYKRAKVENKKKG